MEKETLQFLKGEVKRMVKKDKIRDPLISSEPGKGSHCIHCPECGFTDIRVVGANDETLTSVVSLRIPRDLEEKLTCGHGKTSILIDFKTLL